MGDLVWDERLMTEAEFWALAGPLALRPGARRGLVFLDCGTCGQAVLPLGAARNPFWATVQQIAGAVLRHQVAAHGMPLNHRRGNGRDDAGADRAAARDEQAALQGGGAAGGVRPAATRRRPPAEAAGDRGEPGTAGGDRT